ncbi:MAG: hypothetical protein GXP29_07765 [Planctomycetes bacterium]|nr:hypothetical protein [Planctomycetota bacterium]
MNNIFYMACRHVRFFKVRTLILILGITCTITLPTASHLIVTKYGDSLRSRTASTPYILGARGNRFGLMLKALYFGRSQVDAITLADVNELDRSEWGHAIPLHLGHTTKGHPIVGVPDDYAEFRDFTVRNGARTPQLGGAILGSAVADAMRVGVGDRLRPDIHSLYDIGDKKPILLRVEGVLSPTQSADDHAVFVSLKTAWIMDGVMHGHEGDHDHGSPSNPPAQYQEITSENAGMFHMHASPADIRVSAAIVVPTSDKGATILEARYDSSSRLQLQNSRIVVEEIMGLVVQVKSFFDAYYILVLITTLMFIGLIVALSGQLRKREIETMHLIGASRRFTMGLQAAELLIIVAISTLLSAGLTIVCLSVSKHFLGVV